MARKKRWIRDLSTKDVVDTVQEIWRWNDLATYNAERTRGLVHTPEYVERMKAEQAAFDAEHGKDWA
jgi:hypothetical protein